MRATRPSYPAARTAGSGISDCGIIDLGNHHPLLLRDLGFQIVAGQARLSSKIITIITSVTCVVSLNKSKVVAKGLSSPFSLYTYENCAWAGNRTGTKAGSGCFIDCPLFRSRSCDYGRRVGSRKLGRWYSSSRRLANGSFVARPG
jgi:hypothetical protein